MRKACNNITIGLLDGLLAGTEVYARSLVWVDGPELWLCTMESRLARVQAWGTGWLVTSADERSFRRFDSLAAVAGWVRDRVAAHDMAQAA